MSPVAASTADAYECPSCAAPNVAANNAWCLCTGTPQTLICSRCGRCFCSAPSAWKSNLWGNASPALLERRRQNAEEGRKVHNVDPYPLRPVILLIDDDRIVHIVVPRVLAGFEGTLLHAYDGAEGLRIAQAVKPELVITDALLPGIDGREICQILKKSLDTRGSKVVVMTALYKGARYRTEALRDFAADEFLEKPISADKLRLVVERLLQTRVPAVSDGAEAAL